MADPASVAETIRRHGLGPKKSLGQHFLHDRGILARIAAAAEPLAGATVLEVGPGPGGLTRALLATGAARVVAIDKDARAIRALAELEAASGGRLQLIEGDAQGLDPAGLASDGPIRIVANLPYNVGTPMLLGWLERLDPIACMVLMFQKEVALRLVAAPDTADYGRLAVLAQLMCTVGRLFDLPPGAFLPPPKVSSSVVRLVPRADRLPAPVRARLVEITRAAFGQRRKMLRSSLKGLGVPVEPLLERAGIAATRRAETLALDEFHRLAEMLVEMRRG